MSKTVIIYSAISTTVPGKKTRKATSLAVVTECRILIRRCYRQANVTVLNNCFWMFRICVVQWLLLDRSQLKWERSQKIKEWNRSTIITSTKPLQFSNLSIHDSIIMANGQFNCYLTMIYLFFFFCVWKFAFVTKISGREHELADTSSVEGE